MIDFRARPQDSYIHKADWQTLYVLTEHWKSELLFYNDDLKFLHHPIGNYFMRISKKDRKEDFTITEYIIAGEEIAQRFNLISE
ncbi:MAG: hypothetical protein ACJART_001489 [Maribacter sp.]|jgi:hypothetical protein